MPPVDKEYILELPEEEGDYLKKLHESGDLAGLRVRARELHDVGWTFAAIGQPLEKGRATARYWYLNADPEKHDTLNLPKPERPFRWIISKYKYKSFAIDVPKQDRSRLRELYLSARQARGGTKETARSKVDSKTLDALLKQYIEDGVSPTRLARIMGVTPRAVFARLERSGFIVPPVRRDTVMERDTRWITA